MQIRDRIKEFRRVKARDLRPHPRNWRTHPRQQQDALRGVLAEIGYADALLARELPDGSLQLVDGHLRAELAPGALLPVLVLDVTEEEALKLLATLDPLAAMAGADADVLGALVSDVDTENEAVRSMLEQLVADNPLPDPSRAGALTDAIIRQSYQVVVECADESEQRAVFERMTAEGFKCRVLTL
jgi:hypothetical protein